MSATESSHELNVEPGDHPEGEEGAQSAKKKKKGKKKLLLLVGLVVLLLAGAGGAVVLLKKPPEGAEGAEAADGHAEGKDHDKKSDKKKHASKDGKKEGKHDKDGKEEHSVFVTLPDIAVNLAGSAKHTSFLKIKINLEVADEHTAKVIKDVTPRIVDSFQLYLRQLRIEDLQGSAGMYRLREELLSRVNKVAEPAEVEDVLFAEFFAQ
jgi:flagellar FliL protein